MATLTIQNPTVHAGASVGFWQRLGEAYLSGWQHYARAYGAELDQRPALPLPMIDEELSAAPRALDAQPVVRVWRGLVRAADADAFHRYVQTQGAPSYRRARGNLGVWVLRRPLGAVTEFVLISHWTDHAAVAAYAGGDAAKPLHFAETERYLLPEGEGVEHFDLLPEAAPRYASVRY